MIALYRVPEPDPPGNQAALQPAVSQQLWTITTHNFPPTPDPFDYLSQYFELVVLNHHLEPHRFHYDWTATPLQAFVHPPNAVYLIGPDSRNLTEDDIPQQFQKLKRHHVHIRTDSPHPMFGHVAWAVVYWDRMMKAK